MSDYKAGDQDTTREDGHAVGQDCNEKPEGGFVYCTRVKGHAGNHATGGGYTIIRVWAHDYKVGDPDTTREDGHGGGCDETEPGAGFFCTRVKGHAGNHAAGGGYTIISVWDNEIEGEAMENDTGPDTEPEIEIRVKRAEYPLPNGGTYYARRLAPFPDDVQGIAALIDRGKHIALLGEPGTGKTALALAVGEYLGRGVVTIMGHQAMTMFDFTMRSYIDRSSGKTEYAQDHGPLVQAAMQGSLCYVDEFTLIPPGAMVALYAAADGRGVLPGMAYDGSDVEIAPGFGIVMSGNPNVRGAYIPDPISSRFRMVNVETTEELMVDLGIDASLRTIWKNIRQDLYSWYPSVRTLLAAQEELKLADENGWTYHQVWATLTGPQVPAKDRQRVSGIVAKMLGVRVPQGDYETGLSIR